jgi:hypothetical protein
VSLADGDDLRETLLLDRPNEPLGGWHAHAVFGAGMLSWPWPWRQRLR